jgi:hypothetical protein
LRSLFLRKGVSVLNFRIKKQEWLLFVTFSLEEIDVTQKDVKKQLKSLWDPSGA